MKNYKKILKNQRGSITSLVLVTILFFITILSTAYAINASLRKSQLKSQISIKEEYEKDIENVNEIYESIKPKNRLITYYYIDTNNVEQQKFSEGESVLNTSFTPGKEGYTFVGWREDNTADGSVLAEKIMNTEEISLYAVFAKEVSVSYDANGGDSTPNTQTGNLYYNNGNYNNPIFTLSTAITKTNYEFRAWSLNSATSSTMFDASSEQTFSTNVTLYARWNTYTTMSGSLSASVKNWVGGSRAITFGTVFSSNPTITVKNTTKEPNWKTTVSSINRGACILSWGASGASGASATINWTAEGYCYDDDAPYDVKSGTASWKISNWVCGSPVTVSFGTNFKSEPTVLATCSTTRSGTRPSVTVSNIDIESGTCVLTYTCGTSSGDSGTIYWTATGETK